MNKFFFIKKYLYKAHASFLLWPHYFNKLILQYKRVWIRALYQILRLKVIKSVFLNIKNHQFNFNRNSSAFYVLITSRVQSNRLFYNSASKIKYFKGGLQKKIKVNCIIILFFLLYNFLLKKRVVKKKINKFHSTWVSLKKKNYICFYQANKLYRGIRFPTSLKFNRNFLQNKIYSPQRKIAQKIHKKVILSTLVGSFRCLLRKQINYKWLKFTRFNYNIRIKNIIELQPIIFLFRAQFHFSIYFLERLNYLKKIFVNKEPIIHHNTSFTKIIRTLDIISLDQSILYAIYSYCLLTEKIQKSFFSVLNAGLFYHIFKIKTGKYWKKTILFKSKSKKLSLIAYIKYACLPHYLEASFLIFTVIYCLNKKLMNYTYFNFFNKNYLDMKWLF